MELKTKHKGGGAMLSLKQCLQDIVDYSVVHVYTNVALSASDAVSDSTYPNYPFHIDVTCADATTADVPLCATHLSQGVYIHEDAYAGAGYVRVWVTNKSFGTAYLSYIALLRPPAAG